MNLIQRLKELRHRAYIAYFSRKPIQTNKIILWANSFKQYGCSPKYITEYLLKEDPGRFDLVWVFESGVNIPEDFPKNIRIVRYFSIDYLKELYTARFIICNMRTGPAYYWKKRPEQIYIQTWHSSLRLKRIEGDAAEHLNESYLRACREDSEKIDLLLSGCRFSTDIFKRAFWYDGEILESGTPRCDILRNEPPEIRKKVFRFYQIPEDHHLVLYAPTFRSHKPSDFLGMDFEKLKQTLGQGWTVGARLHPNVLSSCVPEGAVSMSNYPDMQELIAAADILITDFSSCMFDMAIAKKPCFLYAPDLEEYLEKERGLYFDLTKLPFPIARSMEALCDQLVRFDVSVYQDQLDVFMKDIGSFEDGHAAQRVHDYLIHHCCHKTKKEEKKHMNIFCRICNRIRRTASEYRLDIISLKEFPLFLKKGTYFYRAKNISRSVFGLPIRRVRKGEAERNIADAGVSLVPSESVAVYHGKRSGKTVFLYDNFVVSFYDDKGTKWLNNIVNYKDSFPYPASAYFKVDLDRHFAVAERIKGEASFDHPHMIRLANSMLKHLAAGNFEKNAVYPVYEHALSQNGFSAITGCLQHGDASALNILWISDTEYRFIDLDVMDIYPLCYDFFRLILTDGGQAGIQWLVDGVFDDNLSAMFHAAGETQPLHSLVDRYMSIFYVISAGRWQDQWIQSPLLEENYPQTYAVIRKIISQNKTS